MSDYDLLREYAPGHAPERQPQSDSETARDTATVAAAVQHNKPEALGAKGATNLQRLAGNAATSSLVAQREADGDDTSLVHKVVGSGGGSSLDAATRASMEKSFGTDFSSVRIHSGGEAAAAAKSVQAQAFTVGDNIVLGEGKSTSDTRTLAHELTHVVQQRSGEVPGESIGGGIKLSDPGDWAERQAEATADHVMSTSASSHAGHDHAPAGGGGGAGVQREAADEEVQTLPLQRQGEEEDKESEGEEGAGAAPVMEDEAKESDMEEES
ncbi:MAG TPA: DUF4157 domain-containing protein [Acidimicrobiales bacterium]|jgi:hypothetical protein|nr:DUF4157 domain-containing protein [Acidimicrobiales bacterium]